MKEFNGTDLSKAFAAGVDAVALECNKRIVNALNSIGTAQSLGSNIGYNQGYRDALEELLEWMEYDMNKQEKGH